MAQRFLFLVFLVGLATHVCGSDLTSTTRRIPLTFTRDFYGQVVWTEILDDQELDLKKEPAYKGRVRRGLLKLHHDPVNRMAYAYDAGTKKVYLDLNRDRDLTNDPDGVKTLPGGNTIAFDADLTLDGQKRTANYRLTLWDHMRALPRLEFWSWYAGEFESNGKTWVVAAGSAWQTRVLLGRKEPKGATLGQCASATSETLWIVDGKPLKFAVLQDEGTSGGLALEISEPKVPVHKLSLAYDLAWLQLGGKALAVFDDPSSSVLLPEGNYAVTELRLPDGRRMNGTLSVDVGPDNKSVLKAGGPVTSSLSVKRTGMYLKLDYRAAGTGGETYDGGGREVSPGFAVFRGNRKIGGGSFEYG